ncbi:MAG: phosphotransferase [Lachnospiraceae bacterium]|nr:phosphotransferase [Lachnospiraceae bacterium]
MIQPEGKKLFEKGTPEFQRIQALIEDIYQLGTLKKVYEIFGGYVNRSFGVETTNSDGEDVDYFVRRYRITTVEKDIQVEHALVTYAIEHGFDFAAGVYKTSQGNSYVKVPEKVGDETLYYSWAVSGYLYGDDPYDWINNNLKNEEYYSMAQVLAKFHNCTYGFEGGEKVEPPIYEFLEEKKEYFVHCPDGLPIPERDRYLMLYNDSLEYLLAMCDKAKKGIEESGMLENTPKTCCHCDYHVSNVKWKDSKCIGVFDFDWSKEDYRLADIGYSLVISIAAWEALIDGTMDMERVRAYLQGYQDYTKEHGVLSVFSEEEKKAFPSFVLAGAIYLYHWSTDYFKDWENLNEYEYYYYLSHLLKTLRFVEEHQREFYELISSI